ncbi:MAG TPA: hypothetical protein VFT65_03470 [Candidatus Angelobacter sp.]|nr:hypothetical protein [Candidatus Angelobacter sp.]
MGSRDQVGAFGGDPSLRISPQRGLKNLLHPAWGTVKPGKYDMVRTP